MYTKPVITNIGSFVSLTKGGGSGRAESYVTDKYGNVVAVSYCS
ncbi:lasso RiPP family leader peptide-containing protein [Paenibacillus sp. NPDC057886]